MMRMIWLLTNIAIAIIPLGNLLRFDVGTGVALLGLDIVVGLLFLATLPHHVKRRSPLLSDRLFQFFSGFVGIGFVSLLAGAGTLGPVAFGVSVLYLARFVAYGSILWLIPLFPKEKVHILLRRLAFAGLATAVLGLGQYFLYPDLRNLFYLGWDEHLYRLFGTFLDPNFTGAFLVLTLGMVMGMKLLYTHKANLIVLISSVLALSVALTYSRGTYLMLLGSVTLYALLQRKWRLIRNTIIVFTVLFSLLATNRSSEGVNLLRTASIGARVTEYSQAREIIKEKPLIGVGFNAYRYAQLRHGYIDLETWTTDHAGAGVPNSYLFVLATTGIVGFILFVGMWWQIVQRLMHEPVILTLLFGIGVHAFFENTLFYPYLMFVVFILVSARMRRAS